MSIQRGELKVLIDLLDRDPSCVNACDEVRGHVLNKKHYVTFIIQTLLLEGSKLSYICTCNALEYNVHYIFLKQYISANMWQLYI